MKEYVEGDPVKNGGMNLKGIQMDDYDKFYSICDKTMVGFVKSGKEGSLEQHPIQCFYGVKKDAEATDKEEARQARAQLAEDESRKGSVILAQTSSQHQTDIKKRRGKKHNPFAAHKPSADSDLYITAVNANPHSVWKANPCMLTKTHPDYKQCLDKKNTLNLAQTTA